MQFNPTNLQGLVHIVPTVHGDSRGFFMEAFNKRAFESAGIKLDIVQHNQSRSQKGVVRGLHFQWDQPLGKLMRVVHGRAFAVAADIRKNSPTLGQWVGIELSEANKELVWAPFGFATGFCSLEDDTDVEYYYTALYNQAGESNIKWSDQDIGITWPISDPILSPRDSAAQTFKEWLGRKESDLIS